MPSARFPACQPGTTRLDFSSAGRKSPEGLHSQAARHTSDVTALELTIVPDISGGTARASLKSLRLG